MSARAAITQADRDAAAAYSKHWGRHAQAANVKRGSADNTFHLKLLARHREQAEAETVAKIVAWLRETARLFSVEIQAGEGRRDTSELLHHKRACTLAANAIEAGEFAYGRPAPTD